MKLKIHKVLVTAHGEPVRNLIFSEIKQKSSLIKPIPVIKGKYLYDDDLIMRKVWIENIWNLDGSEYTKLEDGKDHSLVEMQPKKVIQESQLILF